MSFASLTYSFFESVIQNTLWFVCFFWRWSTEVLTNIFQSIFIDFKLFRSSQCHEALDVNSILNPCTPSSSHRGSHLQVVVIFQQSQGGLVGWLKKRNVMAVVLTHWPCDWISIHYVICTSLVIWFLLLPSHSGLLLVPEMPRASTWHWVHFIFALLSARNAVGQLTILTLSLAFYLVQVACWPPWSCVFQVPWRLTDRCPPRLGWGELALALCRLVKIT